MNLAKAVFGILVIGYLVTLVGMGLFIYADSPELQRAALLVKSEECNEVEGDRAKDLCFEFYEAKLVKLDDDL